MFGAATETTANAFEALDREETERIFRNAALKQKVNRAVNDPRAVLDSVYEDEGALGWRTVYVQVRMPC